MLTFVLVMPFSFPPLDECNKQVKGDPEKTLFVARLSHDTTEGALIVVPILTMMVLTTTSEQMFSEMPF